VLGKGGGLCAGDATFARSSEDGIPYLPMSMAKGLLPIRTRSPLPPRVSYVLPEPTS